MKSFLTSNRITPAQKQVSEYLHYCEFIKRRAKTTVRTYRKDLQNFLDRTGLRDFRKITNDDLSAWQTQLIVQGLAGKTINNKRDSAIGLMKFLIRQGHKLVIDLDRVDRVAEEQRMQVHFEPGEIAKIKAACESARELVMISLLYDSGMRISELRALKVEHIAGLKIKVIQGKGRKDRPVFITQETSDLLVQWLNLTGTITEYVFPSPMKSSEALSEQQIRDSINAPIRRAGFKKGSAHSMRHSFITTIIDNGMDIFTAQSLAGHSDPKITQRYYHRSEKKLTERYAMFGPGRHPVPMESA